MVASVLAHSQAALSTSPVDKLEDSAARTPDCVDLWCDVL